MTREEEETIEQLKHMKVFIGYDAENPLVKKMQSALDMAIKALKQEQKTDKYEYHTDHTDCIWYGSDSGCPVTCSQYRDGWNDAMKYIYKNGKGYHPYSRQEG